MTSAVPPWARRVFELLVHAEMHRLGDGDFDRRIALIGFDSAIENSITAYLNMNQIHRKGKTYKKECVDGWLNNYHTRLEFLETEIETREMEWMVERNHIVWVHDQRNEHYHGGISGVPEKEVLRTAKEAALWVFSFLFEVADTESELEREIRDSVPESDTTQEPAFDDAIDTNLGIVEIGENAYFASELLFAVDKVAYRAIGEELLGVEIGGE